MGSSFFPMRISNQWPDSSRFQVKPVFAGLSGFASSFSLGLLEDAEPFITLRARLAIEIAPELDLGASVSPESLLLVVVPWCAARLGDDWARPLCGPATSRRCDPLSTCWTWLPEERGGRSRCRGRGASGLGEIGLTIGFMTGVLVPGDMSLELL